MGKFAVLLCAVLIVCLTACGEETEPIPDISEELPPFTDFTDPSPYLTEFTPDGPTIHLVADGSGDYRGLASALEAAEAGRTIYLAEGTYELDQPLEIERSIRLVGTGMEET